MCVLCAKSLQSCLTLCDPMDRSPPDSFVHGILQARMLELGKSNLTIRAHEYFAVLSDSKSHLNSSLRASSLLGGPIVVQHHTCLEGLAHLTWDFSWQSHLALTLNTMFQHCLYM